MYLGAVWLNCKVLIATEAQMKCTVRTILLDKHTNTALYMYLALRQKWAKYKEGGKNVEFYVRFLQFIVKMFSLSFTLMMKLKACLVRLSQSAF